MSSHIDYNRNLQQEIRFAAEDENSPDSMVHAFTEYATDLLTDAGEISNAVIGLLVKPKMRCSAMDWDEERSILSVFTSDFSSMPEIVSYTKSDLTPAVNGLANFILNASQDLAKYVDESQPIHDVILGISECWRRAKQLRFVVLTNKLLKTQIVPVDPIDGKQVVLEIWDLARIQKLDSSGNPQEPVNVELDDYGCTGLPYIGPFGNTDEYQSYLGVIPGDVLASIYEVFGPRLLELNVRSFLQARGKVNKGIQETIRDEPENFFAYNNGLSLTASSIRTATIGGATRIVALENVQIVNGGQTTASLYRALSVSKLNLDEVQVQLKLTVVNDATLHGIAGRISEYSNAQNPVRMADFTANDQFHIELEKLSRSLWAPGREGSGQMTRWFFERARGQYADAVARELTPARQRKFKQEHPVNQKLLKTDVAKYEMMWSQRPDVVSLGAEKCFREFLQDRKERSVSSLPDAEFFQRLAAKAILWRRTESMVTKLHLGGYRAATVAYTLSFLSRATKQMLDLSEIWRVQDLSEDLTAGIQELAPIVHETILASAGSRNVTEWAKRKDCWEAVQEINWAPPSSVIMVPKHAYSGPKINEHTPERDKAQSDEEAAILAEVSLTSSHTWKAIASWSKQTQNLQPYQRGIAFSIGRSLGAGKKASIKQAIQGKKILEEVAALGFDLTADYSMD